jgi:hypothetical protein
LKDEVIVGRDGREAAVAGRVDGFHEPLEGQLVVAELHQWKVHPEVHRVDRICDRGLSWVLWVVSRHDHSGEGPLAREADETMTAVNPARPR